MKEIQSFLVKFGFTNNAAKAYTALLKNSPSTGYEISSQTDIPRSAIYNVLNRLVSQGYANSVGDSPKRYIPLQPPALIALLNQSHNEKLDGLEEAIRNIEIDDQTFDFWHLHGYRNIILKAKELVKNAKKKIVISGWKREIVEIKKVEGNEELFTITKGAKNQVLRSAYLDSLTNKLLIKGIAEKISDG